ncbi:hypothetical protein BaRGS_00021232 [Batillaria attramentaria]|uniref:Uncharacterized protein n=1 Tax=Batillaria attramentaria TaxID=370345 RepID=A0ABD0KK25_9CAEN
MHVHSITKAPELFRDFILTSFSAIASSSMSVDSRVHDQGIVRHMPTERCSNNSIIQLVIKPAGCSQTWNQLLWDNLLWSRRLAIDKRIWSRVSHSSNPEIYKDVDSDLSFKEIYLRCSPDALKNPKRGATTAFHQVSTVLKYLIPKKAPKAAMFGPGLESSTSGIVLKMMYEDNDSFSRVAMFPGQFDGMGAGMTLKLTDGHHFHLSVLYSASKREREQNNPQNRLARNHLFSQQQGAQGSDEVQYQLQPALQQLCHTLNAFIFVVDASGTKEMATSPRLPAVEVVEELNLSSLTRPWMVMDCVVDNLVNVAVGIQWMIEMCQRK